MNTKGLVELIVLNIGKDRGVLNDQTFAIMVLMALFAAFITTPIVIAVYKPASVPIGRQPFRGFLRDRFTLLRLTERRKPSTGRRSCFSQDFSLLMSMSEYKHRKIQRKDPSAQLRMLTCFYGTRNIPSLINLNEASRGTEKKGVCVYAMHLMELTERTSAICMVHKARKNGLPFWNNGLEANANQICNRQVLQHAPCSVGILVDRGLGGTSHVSARNVDYTLTVLFFGGHNDREALSYGSRVAEHPGINLVVVRFLLDPKVAGNAITLDIDDSSRPEARSDDEESIAEFKEKISKENGGIKYEEQMFSNADEVIEAIRSHSRCNMFVVGRIPEGQLVSALSKENECPELGHVGNLLIAADFPTPASVLVVQQYRSQL